MQAYGVRDGAGSPVTWLRIGRFIPWIDLLLSDGRTAFVGEFFGETWPTDPLADDLGELYRPPVPARVASAWLDDLGGPGTAGAVVSVAAGNWIENFEPRPTELSTRSVPFISATRPCAMVKPRPVPRPTSFVV